MLDWQLHGRNLLVLYWSQGEGTDENCDTTQILSYSSVTLKAQNSIQINICHKKVKQHYLKLTYMVIGKNALLLFS